MIKVLSIFGTRPEAIKLAPVIQELNRHSEHIQSRVCVTAQHREMLDQVLNLFNIQPDYDLDIMREAQSLSNLTARVFTNLEPVLESEDPDWVLVQGDTTTVMAAGLAAFYQQIKVGHVEAGLRTFDKWRPFPEEINRRIAGVVADLHFAPTETARENLIREGVPENAIHVTGNTVIDALLLAVDMPFDLAGSSLQDIPWEKDLVLVTAHRRENHGQPLENICRGLLHLTEEFPNIQVVYPVHLSPQVQGPVWELLGEKPGINLLPPLDYLPMVQLMKRCSLVLTDSGGIQEEAPSLGKPVLVLREKTERPEGVEVGTVRLVGTDSQAIFEHVAELLTNKSAYHKMAQAANPYGDGSAAQRIVDILAKFDQTERSD